MLKSPAYFTQGVPVHAFTQHKTKQGTAYLQVLARNLGFTWVYGGKENVASYNARIHHIRLAAGTTSIPVAGGHGHGLLGYGVPELGSRSAASICVFVSFCLFSCCGCRPVESVLYCGRCYSERSEG